jgi:hypothetical protein
VHKKSPFEKGGMRGIFLKAFFNKIPPNLPFSKGGVRSGMTTGKTIKN